MSDIIYRQDAIDYFFRPYSNEECYTNSEIERALRALPSAQPERLTDDDFETIRIHLSAHKEKLCNQGRWKEAEEYQRIIDRFMAFASTQPEIIRCKDCEWFRKEYGWNCIEYTVCGISPTHHPIRREEDFCSKAERRTDGAAD